MIVVDTSALLAILYGEPEAAAFITILEQEDVAVPASVVAEGGILAMLRNKTRDWNRLLRSLAVEVIPLTEPLAVQAVEAYRQFGKGRHKAALNFGDCLVYATARNLHFPLLCKGNDFIQTGVNLHDGSVTKHL